MNLQVGVPPRIVDLHQSFLRGLTRCFRVAQQVSPSMNSSRGVPEGCGFSVCAMLQLNWIMSAKLDLDSSFCTDTQFYNYVDNWLFMSQVRSSLLQTLQSVHDFAPKACFRISPGKTWISSTNPKARNEFRGIVLAGSKFMFLCTKLKLGFCCDLIRKHAQDQYLRDGKLD